MSINKDFVPPAHDVVFVWHNLGSASRSSVRFTTRLGDPNCEFLSASWRCERYFWGVNSILVGNQSCLVSDSLAWKYLMLPQILDAKTTYLIVRWLIVIVMGDTRINWLGVIDECTQQMQMFTDVRSGSAWLMSLASRIVGRYLHILTGVPPAVLPAFTCVVPHPTCPLRVRRSKSTDSDSYEAGWKVMRLWFWAWSSLGQIRSMGFHMSSASWIGRRLRDVVKGW